MLEGIKIQEGSWHVPPYTLGASSQGVLGVVAFVWGAWDLFFGAILSLWFKCNFTPDAFTNGQLQIKCSKLLQW